MKKIKDKNATPCWGENADNDIAPALTPQAEAYLNALKVALEECPSGPMKLTAAEKRRISRWSSEVLSDPDTPLARKRIRQLMGCGSCLALTPSFDIFCKQFLGLQNVPALPAKSGRKPASSPSPAALPKASMGGAVGKGSRTPGNRQRRVTRGAKRKKASGPLTDEPAGAHGNQAQTRRPSQASRAAQSLGPTAQDGQPKAAESGSASEPEDGLGKEIAGCLRRAIEELSLEEDRDLGEADPPEPPEPGSDFGPDEIDPPDPGSDQEECLYDSRFGDHGAGDPYETGRAAIRCQLTRLNELAQMTGARLGWSGKAKKPVYGVALLKAQMPCDDVVEAYREQLLKVLHRLQGACEDAHSCVAATGLPEMPSLLGFVAAYDQLHECSAQLTRLLSAAYPDLTPPSEKQG